MKGPSIQR